MSIYPEFSGTIGDRLEDALKAAKEEAVRRGESVALRFNGEVIVVHTGSDLEELRVMWRNRLFPTLGKQVAYELVQSGVLGDDHDPTGIARIVDEMFGDHHD